MHNTNITYVNCCTFLRLGEKGQKFTPRRISYVSRGTAVEKELEMRLRRNQLLQDQDADIHALRLEEHKLRVEEQRLKVIEQETKNKIIELQLKQVMEIAEK